MSRLLASLIIFLAFIFCLTFFTYPAVLTLNTRLMGDGGDNYQYASLQYVFRDQLKNFKFPLTHTNLYRYPNGVNLGLSSDGLFANLTGALTSFVLPPTLNFNLIVYLLFFLNFSSAFYVTNRITHKLTLSLLSGIIFGFSNYVLVRAPNHLNLGFVAGFPLFYLGLKEIFEKPSTPNYHLALGLLLASFGSLQYLGILLILIIIFLLSHFPNLKNLHPISFIPIAVSSLLILLIFHTTFIGLFTHQLTYDQDGQTLAGNLTTFFDLILPNPYQDFWYVPLIHSAKSHIEKSVFIGYPEIVILCLLLVYFFKKHKPLLISSLLLILFSSGYLYIYLYKLPIFSIIPEPGRFTLPLITLISIEFPLYLSSLNTKARNIILIIAFISIFLGHLSFSYQTAPSLQTPEITNIQKLPGNTVLNLPISIFTPKRNQEAIFHQKAIIDGYLHNMGNGIPSTTSFIGNPMFNRFICDAKDHEKFAILYDQYHLNKNTSDTMRRLGINTIVLHKEDPYFFEECNMTRTIIQMFLPETDVVQTGTNLTLQKKYPDTTRLYQRLFFPVAGTFYLNGLLAAPHEIKNLEIYHNEKSLTDYGIEENQDGVILTPKDTLSYSVASGDTIDIYSDTPIYKTAYLTIWYGFNPTPTQAGMYTQPPVERIFDSLNYSIYQLH